MNKSVYAIETEQLVSGLTKLYRNVQQVKPSHRSFAQKSGSYIYTYRQLVILLDELSIRLTNTGRPTEEQLVINIAGELNRRIAGIIASWR